MEASLRRLQTDYIDLYGLHGGTLDDPIDAIIETFEALQTAGLIRAYGISSIRPNVIREWVKRSWMASVMTQYSPLGRRPEEKTLDLLRERGVGVIARGPVAQGRLSGAGGKRADEGFLEHTPEEVRRAGGALRSQFAGAERCVTAWRTQRWPPLFPMRVGSNSSRRTPSLQPSSSPRRSGGACRARLEPSPTRSTVSALHQGASMDGRNPYTSGVPDAPGSAQGGLAVISVGNWLLTLLLLAVPLVNLVALLYWSFAGAVHPSKRTFAQAALILAVVGASSYLVSSFLTGNVLLTP